MDARPEALPPDRRTVGQLVAESIRFYGDRFWAVLPLGFSLVVVDAITFGRSSGVQTVLLWVCAPLMTGAYVRACQLLAPEPVDRRYLRAAFLAGLIVFLPFPILVRLYVLPGLLLFALLGLCVPAAVNEQLGVREALGRGWQLGRADVVHALGSICTLGLVYGVSKYALLVLLHTQGDQAAAIAVVLADLVLSPLLFVGAALLYVDQAAREE